ncbi:MAG: hypothetical protein KatS3mg114_0635 [Planctomycetaceae bacterium]|nr:MAG: hypothetical protein KatS3mg114_0635 [Planctomycetaceae bacterium]
MVRSSKQERMRASRGLQLQSRALAICCLLGLPLGLSSCITPWERSALLGSRDPSIDRIRGPQERHLFNLFRDKQQHAGTEAPQGSLPPLEGTEEYQAADQLYQNGQYAEAEAAFKKVAKRYKKSDIREDALFMQAESAWKQERYARAVDLYSELLKEYPSTRHMDQVTRRLYDAARTWLDFPQPATLSEVRQVDYDDLTRKMPAEQPPLKPRRPPFVPNLTNRQEPLFDTEGNALSALRLIWLNDPTGPLADDALLLAASHHARRGNWIEADRYYTLLREQYPNSPHVQTAFVMGSHVKLMSYDGPAYEGQVLEDAQKLKESTLRLFPNSEHHARIQQELQKLEEARAAREWALVEFYRRKNNPRAQAVYCHLILSHYPETSYADKARQHLAELGPEYASGGALLDPRPDPEHPWWEPAVAWIVPSRKTPSTPPAETAPTTNPATPSPQHTPETPELSETPSTLARPHSSESPGRATLDPPAETGSRWGRWFRLAPPNRLSSDPDAEPLDPKP